MTDLIEHFRMMARYNRRANERLYDACAVLSDEERKRDRKGFFRSIHSTLNHIMVGDHARARHAPGADPRSALRLRGSTHSRTMTAARALRTLPFGPQAERLRGRRMPFGLLCTVTDFVPRRLFSHKLMKLVLEAELGIEGIRRNWKTVRF